MRGLLPGERSGVGVIICPSVFMGALRNTCGRMMRWGEGGDQRDAVVPALLTLGEHTAKPRRKSPAVSANIGAWSIADHTVSIFENVRREVWVHSRVQIISVNTQIWKRGVHPSTLSSCERGSTTCGSLLCGGAMHHCAWLLLSLCTVARFGYLLRILE